MKSQCGFLLSKYAEITHATYVRIHIHETFHTRRIPALRSRAERARLLRHLLNTIYRGIFVVFRRGSHMLDTHKHTHTHMRRQLCVVVLMVRCVVYASARTHVHKHTHFRQHQQRVAEIFMRDRHAQSALAKTVKHSFRFILFARLFYNRPPRSCAHARTHTDTAHSHTHTHTRQQKTGAHI